MSLYVRFDHLKSSMRRLLVDKAGVTAIEYGLIAGAIAVAIIAGVMTIGGDIKALFTNTGNALNTVK